MNQEQLKEAYALARRLGITPEHALLMLGSVTQSQLDRTQAAKFGIETVDLTQFQIPHSIIELLPESVARENIVIPLAVEYDRLFVATHNPMDITVADKLTFLLNREIRFRQAPREAILEAIDRYYRPAAT